MPAPSPPGLKSSIEYFAMSVGIRGLCIGHLVALYFSTNVTRRHPHPMTIKMSQLRLVSPNASILCVENGQHGVKPAARI